MLPKIIRKKQLCWNAVDENIFVELARPHDFMNLRIHRSSRANFLSQFSYLFPVFSP